MDGIHCFIDSTSVLVKIKSVSSIIVGLCIISSCYLEMNAQHSARTVRDYCCLGTKGTEKEKEKKKK